MADTTVPTRPDGRPLEGKSLSAYQDFLTRLEEFGATLLEPYWLGSGVPHRLVCSQGHECSPTPNRLQQGGGPCRVCGRPKQPTVEGKFRERVEELGGVLLGQYVNNRTPVKVRCAAGHDCAPHPDGVLAGGGICRRCAALRRPNAEDKFRACVEALGGVVIGEYRNSKTSVAVRCALGHRSTPFPGGVLAGGGICRACAKSCPKVAEARFRERVAELGGVVLGAYVDSNTPVAAQCAKGHDCAPRPGGVAKGGGICWTCSGKLPLAGKEAFLDIVAKAGATVVGEYVGSLTPVDLVCAKGHSCSPTPTNVLRGTGICRTCAGKAWDVFYVVTSPTALKFGVTSGDPRPRLKDHRQRGYRTVVRLHKGLTGTMARDLEIDLINAMKTASVEPVRGREYYPIGALRAVLRVVDNRLRGETTDAA